MSSSTNPEDATVARTQQAAGKPTYDVYEVIAEASGKALALAYGVSDDGENDPSADILVHVGTYQAPDPQLACWKAAEDPDAPFSLNVRAQGKQPPVLVAGTTGRGGLSKPQPFGLEPVRQYKRRTA